MSLLSVALYAVALLFIGAGAFLLGRRSAAVAAPLPEAQAGSPVPWINDEVWRQRRDWSRFAGIRGPDDTEGPLLHVEAWIVRPDEKARSPALPMKGQPPVPTGLDQASADRLLKTTPDVGAFLNPAHWPVCCGSMTVLVLCQPTAAELAAIEGTAGSLDDAVLQTFARSRWAQELASIRAGGRPVNGINLFQCAVCGHIYGVYSSA